MRSFYRVVLCVFSAFAVLSCGGNADTEIPDDDSGSGSGMVIALDGEAFYKIVYPSVSNSVSGLAAYLKDKTGATFSTGPASGQAVEKEIIVGVTSARPECGEALAELGGSYGYVVKACGNKIVIVGTDSNWIQLGVRAFVRQIAAKGWVSDKNLTVPRDLSLIEAVDDPQMIARLINLGCRFSLATNMVMQHSPVGVLKVAQGAVSDGKYFYFVMRNTADDKAVVYKYDMATKALVGQSPEFYGGHCNDMAYDAPHKRLIVVHGQSEGKILTPLDAETLSVGPDINISVGSGALTYNESRHSYAISQGGSSFYVADDNFAVKLHTTRTDNTGHTAQGMGSDDSFVYFPMSGSKDNVLVTYDWEGKFVTTLTIPLTIESESMFYAAGKYYVVFYSGGATLYEVQPVYTYTY